MLKFFYIITTLILLSAVCPASGTDCSFYVLPVDENSDDKEDKEKKNPLANIRELFKKQQDTLIKKQLPKEFPTNYHEEVEEYYARQRFHEKVLRKLINTRNYTSFSTNILYDLVLIPNISAEFLIAPNLSLSAGWMHSWWSFKSSDTYWRVYGGDMALKYWFGKKTKTRKLTGHHFGIYAQVLTYDLDLGGQAQMTDGWNKGVGIEYGHSFAISKNFNIDVYAGIGLLTGNYKDYSNLDGHYVWQTSVKRHTVLPTKLGASLVWIMPFKQHSILYNEKNR